MRLWEYLERQITLKYLSRRWAQLRQQYPQVYSAAFDYITLYINVDGRYDKEELAFVIARLGQHVAGRTVLDIGANIGNHALAFAETAARVIALEPHPVTFQLLQLNTRNCRNVTPIRIGASDHSGTVQAITPPGNLGRCSIGLASDAGQAIDFDVVPVDQLPDIADVGLIKIDIEGHEDQALRGAEKLLRRDHPIILLEQNRDAIANGTSASLELLKGFGYEYFYSIDTRLPWKVSLPGPLRRPGRLLEALVAGVPDKQAYAEPVTSLEPRHYPCIVASTHAIPELTVDA